MPQLIHYLDVDTGVQATEVNAEEVSEEALEKLKQISQETLDWGVLAVYTCSASCDEDESLSLQDRYTEEYVYRQPPL
jgi:hypothetical protein